MSAYVRKPGLLKRVYNGESYYCDPCSSNVSGQSPNEHYRTFHQPKVGVRFGKANRTMIITRSLQTGKFQCSRCPAGFKHPRGMQEHALGFDEECPQGAPRHNALSARAKMSERKKTEASTPSSKKPQGHPRKSTSRPPERPRKSTYKEESQIAVRPLKVPTRTRTGIPDISRTTRALIRASWKTKEYQNKEIAEFYGCDIRDVYFAINNESDDNLDEDADYVNGKRGEVVNVDALPDAYEGTPEDEMESYEVNTKLEEAFADYEQLEYENEYGSDDGSEIEVERQYMRFFGPDDQDPSFGDIPPSSSVSSRQPSTSHPPEETMEVDNVDDPIAKFVSALRRPNDVMVNAFRSYGVRTEEDLQVLCGMRDYWGEVEQYFLSQGVSPFQWLVILEGLVARAISRQC